MVCVDCLLRTHNALGDPAPTSDILRGAVSVVQTAKLECHELAVGPPEKGGSSDDFLASRNEGELT